MHVKDRTFVISGGASGLGLATAQELHAHGGYVAILDMHPQRGAEFIAELDKSSPGRARFWELDVTDGARLEAVVAEVAEWTQQTGKAIGAVIPAAGVGMPGKLFDRNFKPIAMEKLDFVIDINLRAVLNLLRLTLPLMAQNQPLDGDGERGVVIMVASSAAFDGQPGQASYAATKGGIRALTLVLARDLAQNGIRAVTIAPSLFETNMTARMSDKVRQSLLRVTEFPRRPGQAPEFATLARHIIENVMLNGETIRLDGGVRMPSKM